MKHVIIIDSVCYLAGLTLKVRRPFVLKKYEATIDAMYNESWVIQVWKCSLVKELYTPHL